MAFHWRSISHILLLVLGIFKASIVLDCDGILEEFGLFLAPIINGGKDPKFQVGVDILFWALVVLVVGSFGTYLVLL